MVPTYRDERKESLFLLWPKDMPSFEESRHAMIIARPVCFDPWSSHCFAPCLQEAQRPPYDRRRIKPCTFPVISSFFRLVSPVALRLGAAPRAMLRKNRRINIRLSDRDVIGLQAKAAEEGMPHQPLISSVLHKYLTGSLWPEARGWPHKAAHRTATPRRVGVR